jgi:hypothetical protein
MVRPRSLSRASGVSRHEPRSCFSSSPLLRVLIFSFNRPLHRNRPGPRPLHRVAAPVCSTATRLRPRLLHPAAAPNRSTAPSPPSAPPRRRSGGSSVSPTPLHRRKIARKRHENPTSYKAGTDATMKASIHLEFRFFTNRRKNITLESKEMRSTPDGWCAWKP